METESKRNVILINSQFNGRYLEDPNHVGGEVINLYQSDNDNFYIYICPYGNVASKWKGRIGHVLFVRSAKNGLVKIIGKAEIGEDIETETFKRVTDIQKDIAKPQKKYIENNEITYGDVPLLRLGSWSNNFVTFKAEAIYKASKDIYLIMESSEKEKSLQNPEKGIYSIPDFKNQERGKKGAGKINNQSQKLYVDKDSDIKDEIKAYVTLEAIIDNKENWEVTPVGKVSLDKETSKKETLLSIIKKEDSELVNSNLLAYLIEYDAPNYSFWKELADNIFNKENDDLTNLRPKVLREYQNIDILIELYDNDDNLKKVIVIENKIRSNINGIIKNESKEITRTQLDKYHSIIKGTDSIETKESKDSQQNPYEKIPADFYILRPNYNNEIISEIQGDWKEIKYSEIKNVLSNLNNTKWNPPYSLAMDELKAVVEMHSSDYDNQLYEEVNRRFINTIINNKKKIHNKK